MAIGLAVAGAIGAAWYFVSHQADGESRTMMAQPEASGRLDQNEHPPTKAHTVPELPDPPRNDSVPGDGGSEDHSPHSASDRIRDEEFAAWRDPALDRLPVLSAAWVNRFTTICTFQSRYWECQQLKELARTIASEPRGEEDSWPYRLEYEIKEYLAKVAAAHGIAGTVVTCNRIGCLIYLTGEVRKMFGRGGDHEAFIEDVHRQQWIEEFEKLIDHRSGLQSNGRTMLQPLWGRFAKTRRDKGLLIIMERAKEPPKEQGQ